MVIKKEMALIGIIPVKATFAKGIQSKAWYKYTKIDFFNQQIHIIIEGGVYD